MGFPHFHEFGCSRQKLWWVDADTVFEEEVVELNSIELSFCVLEKPTMRQLQLQ